jgi:hypothetical protein
VAGSTLTHPSGGRAHQSVVSTVPLSGRRTSTGVKARSAILAGSGGWATHNFVSYFSHIVFVAKINFFFSNIEMEN